MYSGPEPFLIWVRFQNLSIIRRKLPLLHLLLKPPVYSRIQVSPLCEPFCYLLGTIYYLSLYATTKFYRYFHCTYHTKQASQDWISHSSTHFTHYRLTPSNYLQSIQFSLLDITLLMMLLSYCMKLWHITMLRSWEKCKARPPWSLGQHLLLCWPMMKKSYSYIISQSCYRESLGHRNTEAGSG